LTPGQPVLGKAGSYETFPKKHGEQPPPAVFCRRGRLLHKILNYEENFWVTEGIFAKVSLSPNLSVILNEV
jgi:hypothetical protein